MYKIVEFKRTVHVVPDCSCGTGYSEPDVFRVKTDDGLTHIVVIDIWYSPADSIVEKFRQGMSKEFGSDSNYNFSEAFEKYVDELIRQKACPYTKEEILCTSGLQHG